MDIPLKVDIAQDPFVAHNTLSYVFPYLEIPDLLKMAQVCKLWNEIIYNSSLWKSVTLENYRFDFNTMLTFIAQRNTVRLTLVDCIFVQSDHMDFPEVSSLKEFEVSEFKTFINFKKKEVCQKLDLRFLEKLKNLEKLVLNTKRSLVSVDSITNIKTLKKLTHIQFKYLQKLSLQNKSNFQNLEDLEIFNVDNNDLDMILKNLHSLKSLTLIQPSNVFNNSEIYWEKLQVIKNMPSFKQLNLINFDIEYKDVASCPNLEKIFRVPHCTMNICSNVSNLQKSNLTHFVLGISPEHFAQLISATIHSFQRDRSFYPPWEDIPFNPDMLNRLLSLNFGEVHYPEFSDLVNAIVDNSYKRFLSILQDILQKILPNISVSVVRFKDKWSEHERIQWSSEYS